MKNELLTGIRERLDPEKQTALDGFPKLTQETPVEMAEGESPSWVVAHLDSPTAQLSHGCQWSISQVTMR